MDNPNWVKYWRISATSTLTNQNFFALGLPPVNTPNYVDYSEKLPQSQGGQTRQGYKNITLLWDLMTFEQFRILNSIVEAAIAAGTIYATIDRADGTKLVNDFIDISGKPFPLDHTIIANARGVVHQNVTLTINNITIVADPSTIL